MQPAKHWKEKMTEDEERHADEVNIAFQMGADWERRQSKARIEKLEAALREIDTIAINHTKGGIGKAQSIARKALDAE
jgi:hypothetical protein